MPDDFEVKDSGARQEYDSGFVRDTEDGKLDYTLLFDGPMAERIAAHLTKGSEKYGPRNWALACTLPEAQRFRRSAARHFKQWLGGETDEDHAAAATFNMFAAEHVFAVMRREPEALEFLDKARDDEAVRKGFPSWESYQTDRRQRSFVDTVLGEN